MRSEQREFMKAAILAMIVNGNQLIKTPRDLVNKAGELWDELDAQTKDKERE